MTAAFTKLKSHFINWREWELNPIVIKELRQAVRSWAVTGMLLLFLIVLFITSLGFLVTQSFEVNENMQLGGTMFSSFVVILAGASIFFIPLYVGVRVAAERQENNPDLLYVSTLSPARIIRGKFLCGAYMALLFFSACMPFMAFTNLLRGVDLPTVFFILSFLFLVVCATNQIAILFACIPASRPFKVLFALAGFFASFWVVIPLVTDSFEFMHSGVGTMMADRDFWIGVLTAVVIGLAATGLFFVLSVALISPPSANRARPVRIYLTVIWLLGGLLSLGWVWRMKEAQFILPWEIMTFVLMMFALLATISNSDQLSLRVRRTIPQSRLKRLVAFIFFNGAAGGLVWAAMILVATFLLAGQITLAFPKSITVSGESGQWFATTMAYAFAYALMALFIHRKFLSRHPPKLTGLIAVLLAAAWAIAPSIVLFFLNQLSWKSVEGLQLGNVFNVASLRDVNQRIYHLYFAFGWLQVMIVINAKWFVRQVKNFQPLDRLAQDNPPPMLK
ncbi:MAG TPA: hypothetical protein VIK35_02085 [Verrucomicrobiae bacterium]